jgi:RHS repeat-associated protein
MSRSQRLVALSFFLLALLAGAPVWSQSQNPNHERGYTSEKAFEVGELDEVGLQNGNLVVRIPVGFDYPLPGGLSYRLVLSYNAVPWRIDEICPNQDFRCYNWAFPVPEDNSGLGWMFGLGELRPPQTLRNSGDQWIYVSPDGADHTFYGSLHEGEPIDSAQYTRDGSYLRMKAVGGFQDLEFPDGTVHRFESATGQLREIRGPFGTAVYLRVTPVFLGGSLVRWDLTDSEGRTHRVHFVNRSVDGRTVATVSSVDLQSFGGARAVYSFGYQQSTVRRPDQHDYPAVGVNASVPVLTSVTLPDGSQYRMGVPFTTTPGELPSLTLPTQGKIEWDYRNYIFPRRQRPKERPSDPNPAPDPYDRGRGVGARRLVSPTGAVVGSWVYNQFLNDGWTRTEVTDPLGHRTDHFFRAAPDTAEHGLPYRSDMTDGAGRFLSRQVYEAGAATPVRSFYVRYEWDRLPPPDPLKRDNPGEVNRRAASERTVYHDDGGREADVNRSEFDGLGHYRTEVTQGTFDAGNVHRVRVKYNPASGDYAHLGTGPGHSYVPKPFASPWVLETYSERGETESGITAKREYCFEAGTGYLLRERVLLGTAADSRDLVRVYTRDAQGNTIREQHYGGDVQAVGTGALCSLALPPVDAYRLDSTPPGGPAPVRVSGYRAANGTALEFLTTDESLDVSTWLPAVSRDTAGLATMLEYDNLGRLRFSKPATGHDAWTEYRYTPAQPASGSNPWQPARVEILVRPNGSTTGVLSESELLFDPFGRVWKKRKRLPGGVWSTEETGYNALGQKTFETVAQASDSPGPRTQYLEYDPFGRPRVIRPPEGSAHDLRIAYFGVRVVTRTARVGTGRNPSTGAILETDVKTREIYDRQGRLFRFWEDDGGSLSGQTAYAWDVLGRLKSVTMARPEGTQERHFHYDHRGFLRSETHPEKGLFGNGTVTSTELDALGNARRRTDGSQDLRFTFDRAGRLTEVREASGLGRVLEQRTYGTGKNNGDRSAGKLKSSKRFNYHESFNTDFPVQQTYTYGGRGGRVSRLVSALNNTGETYTQDYTWHELGRLASVTYPTCDHCPGGGGAPARTVSYTYGQGFLTAVPGWANAISYHANGLWHQITHANGVVTTQGLDPSGQRRPGSIAVHAGATPLFATGSYSYDGSGNVVRIGGDYYLYDALGRLVEGTAFQDGQNKRQSYGFDRFGNLTAVSTVVNGVPSARTLAVDSSRNRLSAASYDDRGYQTSWGVYGYTWDPMGNLKSFTGGGNNAFYAYDADDERVLSFDLAGGGIGTFRLRDLDGRVLREFRLAGGVWSWQKDWVYREGQLLATQSATDGVRLVHPDHLGTPRITTDAVATVRERRHLYPFGELATSSGLDNLEMAFTGHERDQNGVGLTDDLDYMHARYYNPMLGRFLSVDPGASAQSNRPQSWNKYLLSKGIRSFMWIRTGGSGPRSCLTLTTGSVPPPV